MSLLLQITSAKIYKLNITTIYIYKNEKRDSGTGVFV